MYSYFKGLTHLRYLVYKDEQNQKKVLFWVENIIHTTYAIENGIKPQQLTSLGYIGFHKGKWVLYEHYQLDERNISNEWREKKTDSDKIIRLFRNSRQEITTVIGNYLSKRKKSFAVCD